MNRLFYFILVLLGISIFAVGELYAQPSYVESQKTNTRSADVFNRVEDSVIKQFEEKKLTWPPQSMYIRSFKYDRQLEVWVKNKSEEQYQLFKSYKVCMQSGTTGPKRFEGDFQVPEGFYYINEFNPNSKYHLSLGLNYPNSSDKILSDANRPGSAIYIHGNCVSTGCIAIQDAPIEELYIIASNVRANGQDFIPVHVFPVNYGEQKSVDKLAETFKSNLTINKFILSLKSVFDHFEKEKELPLIMVNKKGEYVVN